ncbi:MAG TPA: secretin N-terminal domain-containing protein, partial [Humisphaera sp.]|nr:secretin N-terminal domain-containing protein [Humisphaera sp.]
MEPAKRAAGWVATSLAIVLSATVLGEAQTAPPQGPATRPATVPTTQAITTQPTTRDAATRPTTGPSVLVLTTQPTTIPSTISLNFKDTPLDNVLDFLTRTLGYQLLKDGPIEARVNITSRQPVTPEEAITLVNAALKANGFVVVREGRILHVLARDKAKKGNVPVHFGNNPEDIAETDELITQVIPIQNVNATKLRDDLKPMLPDADFIANEGSNSIIITDASATIRRLVQIIKRLDEHEAETSEIHITQLKHANAAAVAKLIEAFFKSPSGGGAMTPQQQQQMQMMMQQGQQPKMPGGGSERHGNTVITASDDRTNTLLVMANAATLKTIDGIVQQLDSQDPNPAPASQLHAFPLKFAVAEDTAKLINSVFKVQQDTGNSYSSYIMRILGQSSDDKKDWKINAAFDERTNTVIVTGSQEAIAAVGQLIQMLDANPLTSSVLKVFHLRHANAYDVSKLVQDMFSPKDEGGPRFPFLIFSDNPAPPARQAKLHVTYDDRTNSVIVTAPAEMMKGIGDVILELDADPTSEDTLFIYHLRNAQAANLEYVLNVLFGNINTPNQNNGQNNGQNQNPNQQNQNRFGPDNGNGNGNNGLNGNNNNRNNNRNNNNNNRRNRNGMPGMSPNIAHAVNELTGEVFVVADPDTNSLMVTTASKYEKQVRMIIDDLDRPVPQVLIKVLVAEVTHDNSADLGLDFSILNQRPSGQGQTAAQVFGVPSTGVFVRIMESNLNATLHALATQDRLDVLSRPYILASDNQLADIFIGSNVPFVTSSQVTDSGQLINTIQNRDIGLDLSVTPHINPDGLVILDVDEEVQQLTAQTVPISNTTSAPVISKRSAQSRIGVMNNQTVVIGGLMEDRKTETISKIPLLGDIPGVGFLFRRTQTSKTKTELLIFLTPHVAQQPEILQKMSDDELRGTKLTPNAVEPGSFQNQMNGMHRGQAPMSP